MRPQHMDKDTQNDNTKMTTLVEPEVWRSQGTGNRYWADARDAGTRMQGSAARATRSTTISTRSVGDAVTAYCGASTKTTRQTSRSTGHKASNRKPM